MKIFGALVCLLLLPIFLIIAFCVKAHHVGLWLLHFFRH